MGILWFSIIIKGNNLLRLHVRFPGGRWETEMESILNRKNLILGNSFFNNRPPKKGGGKIKDEELLPLKVYSLTGSIQLNIYRWCPKLLLNTVTCRQIV